MNTYIIAEAGVNHNGSFEIAKELVKKAKESGADAVKFQTFKAENLVTRDAKQAAYQVENLGRATTQYDMLKSLELSFEEFKSLKEYCDTLDIEFLSTPFDVESVDFLLDDLLMKIVKVPSGELTNTPFLHYIATKQKKMIISTGMATMDEIHEALSFIAFGLSKPNEEVKVDKVHAFYKTKKAKEILQQFVTVLHCTTEYPAPFNTINLNAMKQLENELQLPIGFSDHSEGIAVPIAAVGAGAKLIEKHFTLDRQLPGPDHLASLEPNELLEMVTSIRNVEIALGSGVKAPTSIELSNRNAARKSVVASKDINEDDFITNENIMVKRPGTGLAPSFYWSLLGTKAKKSYKKDDFIVK
ncbi:N-acetylneuraminate synthase [Psychrobacillus sp. NPDC058041]|uniref:N-acetylneuraminate synthase n=1 Tax=Psychrobacillus sp. NPDC058041 TaxID=3346310 RepID=UPI0036D7C976